MLALRGARVFLLGGPGTASFASELASRYPGLQVVGNAQSTTGTQEQGEVVARVRASGADFLLTGFPAPRQETWLAEHGTSLGLKCMVGLGDVFSAQGLADARLGDTAGGAGLAGRFKVALAVLLQRILGGIKPLREAPVVIRPGDVRAPSHAIVLAGAEASDGLLRPFDVIPALLPVGALTALASALEHLSEKGCRHVDLVTDADPLRLRETIGYGERWGLTIELHLAQDEEDILRRVARLDVLDPASGADGMPLWLVDAGCWIPYGALGPGLPESAVWCGPQTDRWAGWACLPRPLFAGLFDGDCLAALGRRIVQTVVAAAAVPVHVLTSAADLGTLAGVMAMTRQPSVGVLEAANWRQLPVDDRVTGVVWISREAQIEPGARLAGPVYIGPGCHVASQASLGPGVILGRHVRIAAGATLIHAVVLDGVAVGQGLEINESLVHASGIANLTWGAIVPAEALGSLLGGAVQPERPGITVAERLLALLLWLLLPILSLLPGARGPGTLARAFRTRLRGGLLPVVLGRRALVGRSSESAELAQREWKELEFEPFGAIAVGDTWGADSADEHVLADVYWTLHRTWPHRLRVLRTYMGALASGGPDARPRAS